MYLWHIPYSHTSIELNKFFTLTLHFFPKSTYIHKNLLLFFSCRDSLLGQISQFSAQQNIQLSQLTARLDSMEQLIGDRLAREGEGQQLQQVLQHLQLDIEGNRFVHNSSFIADIEGGVPTICFEIALLCIS